MTFWQGKRVLITGHTGFKGGWLSLWLQKLGAQVIGYSLKPDSSNNLFEAAYVAQDMISIFGDIKDVGSIVEIVKDHKPEIVFHLAAQPLVRASYVDPIDTYAVNVMGTVNILNAVRLSDTVKVVVNITTDKCYENMEWDWSYRETDRLGGHDPYSASKACSELVTDSFRKSFLAEQNIHIASVRAGNVIGGGDWAADRLIPDVIDSIRAGRLPMIRNPYAVRPWQHVLEPLHGYLILGEKLYNKGSSYAAAWNFGPGEESILTVGEVADMMLRHWGSDLPWHYDKSEHPHEAQILKLDSSKARSKLNWKPRLNVYDTLKWTVDWYKQWEEQKLMKDFTMQQIEAYERKQG
ncbi:CDP-glucose 4,6-dehydratase [Paenibacillus sp. V4I3]|uniref:CDP-glucose 4,6-dehydratase n=1 Tax=Paenibacillus sp. V4I3 TaxID=3042305 RepID=UPI00278B1787|nr:CDP-glucose 4,6-dehydratase [Paenibacillus sp. V4I3]